ncbi:MAG: phage scaffolding protein [Clostridia bacterium]|nr:phage scaffolding protein [Clostridia bacterium]
MKKEDLSKVEGLTEDQINSIIAVSTEELKGFIPKARFDEINDTKKELDQQIKDRDKQLKDLQDKAKGNEELERTIATLQETNKTAKETYDAKLKDMTINSAIQAKLTDTKYPDLLVTKFDKSKIVVSVDGAVSGIDEQLITIKETYKDLFVPVVTGKGPNNTGGSGTGVKNPWSKEHFNLTEQGKMLRENPELAKQYRASV